MSSLDCQVCGSDYAFDQILVGTFKTCLCDNCSNKWSKFIRNTAEFKQLNNYESKRDFMINTRYGDREAWLIVNQTIMEYKERLFDIAEKWLKEKGKNHE